MNMKKILATVAVALASAAFSPAQANTGGPALDTFPMQKTNDLAAMQNGAKLFVNYCLNCHSASFVRYNRMKDLGLTETQIKENLMFATDKVGDQMTIALKGADAKAYFGAIPPDLSLTARARSSEAGSGADWIYTYLRSFYRDAARPTGWNNTLFENVGMPHILWSLQGSRLLTKEQVKKAEGHAEHESFVKVTTQYDQYGLRTTTETPLEGHAHEGTKFIWEKTDAAQTAAYDEQVADLTAFLVWASDPTKARRTQLGVIVIIFLLFFTVFAWGLNRSYWKDIK
jgi:ubiquinol-cytochrome c reductase cytochrome c1 subunit